jgi:hypothetical protein
VPVELLLEILRRIFNTAQRREWRFKLLAASGAGATQGAAPNSFTILIKRFGLSPGDIVDVLEDGTSVG